LLQTKGKTMAKLYINKDIASDDSKMAYWLSGEDSISYNDIQAFLDSVGDDNRIDVEIHSCGGNCIEGYAIYDALRVSGKEIACTVVGTCASMATVILLAAPLERRAMYQNARLLIHNPFIPELGKATIDTLNSALNSLNSEKERMLNIYTERTGRSREDLEAQMATDDWFGSEKAIELGFVSYVVPAASASVSNNKNKTEMSEKKEKPSVAEAFRMLGVALGVVKDAEATAEQPEVVSMTITTVTGTELVVEREEGEPQVGDAASPDGEHVLEDGRTIVVEGGVITDIKSAEEEVIEEEVEEAKADDTQALKDEIASLKAEIETLKSNAKSDEDAQVLAKVQEAGGIEKLINAAASKYVPAARTTTNKIEKQSLVEQKLAEARAKQNKRFNK
jgi:ATP-dependent Clp protease protease subunit